MSLNINLSRLQDQGQRITKIRRAVLEVFSQMTQPIGAEEIENILKDRHVSVNRATIYRELQFLAENEYILSVNLYPNRLTYESTDLAHHHHLVCDSCGGIDNVTNCLIDNLEREIYKKKGFKISRHMLEFYGTCPACLKKI